jgi:hypothetical protein
MIYFIQCLWGSFHFQTSCMAKCWEWVPRVMAADVVFMSQQQKAFVRRRLLHTLTGECVTAAFQSSRLCCRLRRSCVLVKLVSSKLLLYECWLTALYSWQQCCGSGRFLTGSGSNFWKVRIGILTYTNFRTNFLRNFFGRKMLLKVYSWTKKSTNR